MIIKTGTGDGRWRLRAVANDRWIEWSTSLIAAPCDNEDGDLNWDYLTDDRLPDAESGELHPVPGQQVTRERMAQIERSAHPDVPALRLFRWVLWDTGNGSHLLVTDGPVFICNDTGDTVEAIR